MYIYIYIYIYIYVKQFVKKQVFSCSFVLKWHKKTKRNMIKLTRCMKNKSTVLHVEKERAKCVHNGLYISLIKYTYNFGRYNPSVRIIDTIYVACVNFIHKWRDLQFKVNFERQIFLRNFSWQFLFTLRVFARNLLRGNRQRNTFRISFGLGLEPRLFV